MKTIEERAREYAPDPVDPDFILPAREEYIVNQQRNAYIAGAIDQKVIDDAECVNKVLMGKGSSINCYKQGYHDAIDKACEWFTDYLMEIGYPDDWMRDSPNMASGKERFIKALMDKYKEE